MTSLNNFTRSSEPITDFDDGLCGTEANHGDELVQYRTSVDIARNISISAIIHQLITLYEKNPHKRERVYHLICQKLLNAKVITSIWKEDSGLLEQCKNGFMNMLEAALQTVNGDLSVATTSSISHNSVVRFIQPLSCPNLANEMTCRLVDYITSCSELNNKYRDIKRLEGAVGAYGTVYEAVKRSDNMKYAIKKIIIDSSDIESQREVEILANLSHCNVVRYYDSWRGFELYESDEEIRGSSNGSSIDQRIDRSGFLPRPLVECLYISMELCSETLKDYLDHRRGREIDFSESYKIIRKILKGVEYIHSKELMHRDLKPQNIFLIKEIGRVSEIKIGDFGLARKLRTPVLLLSSPLQRNDDTRTGEETDLTAKVGTPTYGAPEQLDGCDYTQKCDMYGVGLMMYELYYDFLTDRERIKAFEEIKEERMDKKFEDGRRLEASCIRTLTLKNSDDRPSATEALQELKRIDGLTHAISSSDAELRLAEKDDQLREKDRLISMKDREIEELKNKLESETLAKDRQIKELIKLLNSSGLRAS